MKKLLILPLLALVVTFLSSHVTTASPSETKTIEVTISGVTCSGDIEMIEKEVKKLKGVKSVKCYVKKSMLWIKYDDSKITNDKIKTVIENVESCDGKNSKPYKVEHIGQ